MSCNFLNKNDWSQSHIQANTAKNEAMDALHKQEQELGACKQKESDASEAFDKFSQAAKEAQTDWVKFSGKAKECTNKADSLSKQLSSIDDDTSSLDEQIKNAKNSDLKNNLIKSKQDKQLQIQSKKDKLNKEIAELRKQAIQQNLLADQRKTEFTENKQKADAKEKELIQIRGQELPKETKDVELAQKHYDDAENTLKREEEKDNVRKEQEERAKTEEKVKTSSVTQTYNEKGEDNCWTTRELSDDERKENAAQAKYGSVKSDIRYEESNNKKLNNQLEDSKSMAAGYQRSIDACQSSIDALEQELKTCKDENRIADINKELEGLRKDLANVKKGLGESQGEISFYENMISSSDNHIAQRNESLNQIRQDNNWSDSEVKPIHYTNITDVSAAMNFRDEVNTTYNNCAIKTNEYRQKMPSMMTSLTQLETTCNQDIESLKNALADAPDSKKSEINQQITKLQAQINEIKAEKETISNHLDFMENSTKVAKDNVKWAEIAYDNAIKRNKDEIASLKPQVDDSIADTKSKKAMGDQSVNRGIAQHWAEDVTDHADNKAYLEIENLQNELNKLDPHSAEYATKSTRLANLMNDYGQVKSEYFDQVDRAEDAVKTVENATIGVATAGITGGGSIYHTIGGIGFNMIANAAMDADNAIEQDGEISIHSGSYGKSDAGKIADNAVVNGIKAYAGVKLSAAGENTLNGLVSKYGKPPIAVKPDVYNALKNIVSNGASAASELITSGGLVEIFSSFSQNEAAALLPVLFTIAK